MPSSELRRALDGILLEHRADAVVLADVAQEVDGATCGAVQSRLLTSVAALSPSKLRNLRDLRLQVADPLGDGLLGVERALGASVAGRR